MVAIYWKEWKISHRCNEKEVEHYWFLTNLGVFISMKLTWSINKTHCFTNDKYLEKQSINWCQKQNKGLCKKRSEGCILQIAWVIKCSRTFILHRNTMDEEMNRLLGKKMLCSDNCYTVNRVRN